MLKPIYNDAIIESGISATSQAFEVTTKRFFINTLRGIDDNLLLSVASKVFNAVLFNSETNIDKYYALLNFLQQVESFPAPAPAFHIDNNVTGVFSLVADMSHYALSCRVTFTFQAVYFGGNRQVFCTRKYETVCRNSGCNLVATHNFFCEFHNQ